MLSNNFIKVSWTVRLRGLKARPAINYILLDLTWSQISWLNVHVCCGVDQAICFRK